LTPHTAGLLLGGLGLLLIGMSLMTEGLKLAAGSALRAVLDDDEQVARSS
jgi:phosphate:Na+ symporter